MNPLYDYASCNWGYHTRKTPNLSYDIMDFFDKLPQVEVLSQVLIAMKRYSGHSNYSQDFPSHSIGLHLSAYFGIMKAVKALL